MNRRNLLRFLCAAPLAAILPWHWWKPKSALDEMEDALEAIQIVRWDRHVEESWIVCDKAHEVFGQGHTLEAAIVEFQQKVRSRQ